MSFAVHCIAGPSKLRAVSSTLRPSCRTFHASRTFAQTKDKTAVLRARAPPRPASSLSPATTRTDKGKGKDVSTHLPSRTASSAGTIPKTKPATFGTTTPKTSTTASPPKQTDRTAPVSAESPAKSKTRAQPRHKSPSPITTFASATPSALSRSPHPSRAGSPSGAPVPWTEELKDWAWTPMRSRVKGVQAEQRVIYARPMEMATARDPMLWTFAGIFFVLSAGYGVYVYAYYTNEATDEIIAAGGMWDSSSRTIAVLAGPLGLLGIGTGLASILRARSATIVRLSQIRTTGGSGTEAPRTFIRLVHGTHSLAVPPWRQRDVPLEAIRLYNRGNGTVRLDIVGEKSLRAEWNKGYKLSFLPTKAIQETTKEVVVNPRKVEHVFGFARPMPKGYAEAEAATFGRWLRDKLLGTGPPKGSISR